MILYALRHHETQQSLVAKLELLEPIIPAKDCSRSFQREIEEEALGDPTHTDAS